MYTYTMQDPTDEEIATFFYQCGEEDRHWECMKRLWEDQHRERCRKIVIAQRTKERILEGPPPIKRKTSNSGMITPSPMDSDHPIFQLLSFRRAPSPVWAEASSRPASGADKMEKLVLPPPALQEEAAPPTKRQKVSTD